MNFIISPFFYYISHQRDIDEFITLEAHGEYSYFLDKKFLQNIVSKYIRINSHGIDKDKKDLYIEYIIKQLII